MACVVTRSVAPMLKLRNISTILGSKVMGDAWKTTSHGVNWKSALKQVSVTGRSFIAGYSTSKGFKKNPLDVIEYTW